MMSLVVAVVAMLTVAVIAFGAGVSFGAAVPRRAMGMFGDVAGILERAIDAVERAGERGNLVVAQLLESGVEAQRSIAASKNGVSHPPCQRNGNGAESGVSERYHHSIGQVRRNLPGRSARNESAQRR